MRAYKPYTPGMGARFDRNFSSGMELVASHILSYSYLTHYDGVGDGESFLCELSARRRNPDHLSRTPPFPHMTCSVACIKSIHSCTRSV